MTQPDPPTTSGLARWWHLAAKLAGIFVLIWLVARGAVWLEMLFETTDPETQLMITGGLLVAYIILIALPFVPGVELGLSILLVKGPDVALPVYGATVAGLMLAYAVGRVVPVAWCARLLIDFGKPALADRLRSFMALSQADRLDMMQTRAPRPVAWICGRFRYVLLAVLVNMPGSSVIGGGGGILLMAGLSRLFATPLVLVTPAVAVAPVPLLVWFFGAGILSSLPFLPE